MSLQEDWKSLGFEHGWDCACGGCVDHLLAIACKSVPIEQQIEIVVGIISDIDAPELIPVLRTLQFVRDNQVAIRGAVKKGK
jgi:hypothetical protein